MVYSTTLVYPGTIRHLKRGRIDLCKLSQKELKELYDGGCAYVQATEGKPPVEKDIVVEQTPPPKRVVKRKAASKSKPKAVEPSPPEPESIPIADTPPPPEPQTDEAP
jgi:hypothetical protein